METKVINLCDMVNASIVRKVDRKMDPEAMMKIAMSNPGHQARVKARREEWIKAKEAERRRIMKNLFLRKVCAVGGLFLVTFGLVALGTIL